jgi:uncharacterized protein YdeI (YjbR/CyaY-like superfamily)
MKFELNVLVDQYLLEGCMRCKFGATPRCKVNKWRKELESLRQLVLETGLKEELKWGVPVYTHQGKNIVTITTLKDAVVLGFFKGVLLTDPHHLLQQQSNIQFSRIIKFTHIDHIEHRNELLKAYILEAIALEESGKKIELPKVEQEIPDELQDAFVDDPAFRKAFYRLTPGRQRGYLIHFSQSKISQTRTKRIEQYKESIFNGIGLNDKYQK